MAGIGHRGFMGRKTGGIPVNPCGTGTLYPPGWRFLHDEISGGLGSWGNMLKVSGFNSFGAFLEDVSSNSTNLCYKDGSIDLGTADAFFSGDADVETLFDQLQQDDALDNSAGFSYVKSSNEMSFEGGFIKSSLLSPSGIASINIGSPWTICYVLDYDSLPVTGIPIRFPLAGAVTFFMTWSGNNVSLITRFQSPNQGYFYDGLRSSGTKLLIVTYDGTSPINRSGINLYWNGSLETPDGIYNSGAPSNNAFDNITFGLSTNSGGYFREFDMFNFAFDASDVATAKAIYEQKYTFS